MYIYIERNPTVQSEVLIGHYDLLSCFCNLDNLGMSVSSFYYEAGDIVLHFDKEGRALADDDNEARLERLDRSQLLSFLRQAQLAHRWVDGSIL